jgi:hypothetical protein
MDIPVPIHLPVGLSKPTLARWRDSLSYVVIGMSLPAARISCKCANLVDASCAEKPSHGKLSEHVTTNDFITYVPNPGKHQILFAISPPRLPT